MLRHSEFANCNSRRYQRGRFALPRIRLHSNFHNNVSRSGGRRKRSEYMLQGTIDRGGDARSGCSIRQYARERCGNARLYSVHHHVWAGTPWSTHVVLGYSMVFANLIPWRAPVRKWPFEGYRDPMRGRCPGDEESRCNTAIRDSPFVSCCRLSCTGCRSNLFIYLAVHTL